MPKKKDKRSKTEIRAMNAMKAKLANIKATQDKMEREHKMTAENLPKVVQKYYPSMKESTLISMRKDLKAMQQIYRRVLDLKNYVILSLNEDRQYTEDSYKLQRMTHMGHIDNLLEIMQARLSTLAESYQSEKQTLIDKYEIVKQMIEEGMESEQEILKVGTFVKTNRFNKEEEQETEEFTLKLEQLKDRLQMNHDQMEGTYESLLKRMWSSLQKFFLDYQQKTAGIRNLYLHYLQLERNNCNCIRRQANWISSSNEQVHKLKEKLKKCKENYKNEVESLKEERQKCLLLFKQKINQLKFEEMSDFKRLEILVVHSNETEKKLKELVSKAEKILTLAQICRALETQNEKIALQSQISVHFQDIQRQNEDEKMPDRRSTARVTKIINLKDEYLLQTMQTMEHFWERVAVAKAHCTELVAEKEMLVQENVKLKGKLREILKSLGSWDMHNNKIDKIRQRYHPKIAS